MMIDFSPMKSEIGCQLLFNRNSVILEQKIANAQVSEAHWTIILCLN